MINTLIEIKNLQYFFKDKEIFSNISIQIPSGKIGIIGNNGIGKTTLLKLIKGEYLPTGGSIKLKSSFGYLPQSINLDKEKPVSELIGIKKILAAIARIESGDFAENDFEIVGNNWNITEEIKKELSQVGLEEIDLNQPANNLSGGQIVILQLITQFALDEDLLLLDEPTNNLDIEARDKFFQLLNSWNKSILIVSHDVELLNKMDYILEIFDQKIEIFKGNYAEFSADRDKKLTSLESEVEIKKRDFSKQKKEIQATKEKLDKRAITGKRNAPNKNLPKILLGGRKESSQNTKGKVNSDNAKRLENLGNSLDDLSKQLRKKNRIKLIAPEIKVHSSKHIMSAKNINYMINGKNLFPDSGVSLEIVGPERIVISGANGSGKSTFIKILNNILIPSSGELKIDSKTTGYLSQKLDAINLEISVLENFTNDTKGLLEKDRKYLLSHFGFTNEDMERKAKTLSGGEMLKLSLAIIFHNEFKPNLLLLDEPTNNLDLVAKNQLVELLLDYGGAFILVSHDKDFIENIKPTRIINF